MDMNITIEQIRKLNLKILVKEVGSQALLADKADTKASYISQILSDKINRNLGADLARKLEAACQKENGWMDVYHPEEKEWKEVTGYLDSHYDIHVKNVTRAKLDEILDTADRAMDDTGKRFNETERIDLYFEAIEFALRREFSPQFVKQYMEQLVKERKEDKD